MKTNKQSGFSLVELMVVVAIIGILATIAIPNFSKFQAKAKQSSAKSELTGIYTAEKAFFTEYSTYHTNLAYVGFAPDGFPIVANCPTVPAAGRAVRYYSTGFVTAPNTTAGVNRPDGAPPFAANCTARVNPDGTAATAGAGVALVNYFPSTVAVAGAAPAAAGAAPVVAIPLADVLWTASDAAFLAGAAGNISGRGNPDTWTINENKALVNTFSSL